MQPCGVLQAQMLNTRKYLEAVVGFWHAPYSVVIRGRSRFLSLAESFWVSHTSSMSIEIQFIKAYNPSKKQCYSLALGLPPDMYHLQGLIVWSSYFKGSIVLKRLTYSDEIRHTVCNLHQPTFRIYFFSIYRKKSKKLFLNCRKHIRKDGSDL